MAILELSDGIFFYRIFLISVRIGGLNLHPSELAVGVAVHQTVKETKEDVYRKSNEGRDGGFSSLNDCPNVDYVTVFVAIEDCLDCMTTDG